MSAVVAGCHVNSVAPKAEMQDMAEEEVPRVLYVKHGQGQRLEMGEAGRL